MRSGAGASLNASVMERGCFFMKLSAVDDSDSGVALLALSDRDQIKTGSVPVKRKL